MGKDILKESRQLYEKYKKALIYIDECGEFTYEKFYETSRIAGIKATDFQIRATWEQTDDKEFLRQAARNEIIKNISFFERIANEIDKPQKKTYKFWKK